jgi:predicted metal-binding protein
MDRAAVEKVFREFGFADFKWLSGADIVIAEWVRMKCMFGCGTYGKGGCCPPNTPSVAECRDFFSGYAAVAVFHFAGRVDKPEDRYAWTRELDRKLLEVEKQVFFAGYHKVFLLFVDDCHLCAKCSGVRADCRNPKSARPSPESMAVDVYATVRKLGYPIEVLSDYGKEMNRYAFLLVE